MSRASFTLAMLGIAGAMALVLGTVGLYGIIAYSVSQRTREIGIRLALGAQGKDVMSLVLTEGVFVILTGLAIGLAGSLALTRFLSSLLFGVDQTAWGAPSPDQVIAHTNLYWGHQTAPSRKAETVETKGVHFGGTVLKSEVTKPARHRQ